MIEVDNIPAELRALRRWVVWKYENRGGPKPTKPPFIAGDPNRYAKSDDPSTWRDFDTAFGNWEDGKCDGIGFCLGDGWAGCDLDDCIDPVTGEIEPDALKVVEQLNSYTEISPSGMGIKILIRGSLPPGRRRLSRKIWASGRAGAIEMYDTKRYFTITGRSLEVARD